MSKKPTAQAYISGGPGDLSKRYAKGRKGLGARVNNPEAVVPGYYVKKRRLEKELGREATREEVLASAGLKFGEDGMAFDGGPMPADVNVPSAGTSIFDPVLCELIYRWFCPTGGMVLDPFAGGSVRGIVAAVLGLQYVGIDLSARQIEANEAQAGAICTEIMPHWIVGDSKEIDNLWPDAEADLVFSCLPYHDLEIYTDDPADLSTMDWPAFLVTYREIIAKSVARLNDNRFACFVVGNIRDKQGCYRNFVGETVQAFHDAGATLYNDAVLVTAVGSLPIRVGRQFSAGRKLGKTHQNVLVFYKGDPKQIREHFPQEIEFADLAADTAEA